MPNKKTFLDEIGGLDFIADLAELSRRGDEVLPAHTFDRHAALGEQVATEIAEIDAEDDVRSGAEKDVGPVQRYASLEAIRNDGYEPVGPAMYRKAHHLWSVSITDDGQLGVWRHAPEPSADLLLRDRSLVGRRGRARIQGRIAAVTVIDVTDEGVHVEHNAGTDDQPTSFVESLVIPASDLVDFDEVDDADILEAENDGGAESMPDADDVIDLS